MKKVLVREKFESLTLSNGQYYSENIFHQSKELAAEMAQIPRLSMLVPKRVFVQKNKIYLDEVHVDLENVTSQINSVTEASRLEKLTPQSLDFWGIQCPEKTFIQSKLCQNSDLEESIMQQDN